jgi:hypothetical protein
MLIHGGSLLRRSVSRSACALLVAALSCLVAFPALAVEPSAAGLTVERILDNSTRGDVVSFENLGDDATAVGGSVFGTEFVVPLTATGSTAPTVFAQFAADTTTPIAPAFAGINNAAAQAVGVEFNFLGANGTMALQSSGPSFGSGASAQYTSQGPAVFAFYNFPQATPKFSFGSFNLADPSGGALAADLAPAQLQANSAPATGALGSPLISRLSDQGPYWYNAYSPATRGSSIQLNFPFKLARIPVKLRLGEQSITDVQSSSLATQILSPAFASSAASKYNALSGGVTLGLPLLNRRATVSLDGLYETLQRDDKTPFGLAPFDPQTAAALGSTPLGAVVYYPNYADLQQYVGAASVAVPLTRSLTVNGSISEQLSGGVALDTLTQSLSQHRTAYGGGVAYNIPKTNSSINLFFNKNVYTDENVPTYNFTQNQQNLYFSVKF